MLFRVVPAFTLTKSVKKEFMKAIDKLSTPKKMLIEKYTLLKERLGKVPSIVDFYVQGEVDPAFVYSVCRFLSEIFANGREKLCFEFK